MSGGIGILVGMVTNLERDYELVNKKELEPMAMMKDRAVMIVPLIKISCDEPTNAEDFNLLDELLLRVQTIIAKTEDNLIAIDKGL